jgi:hypothetical protein
MVHYKLHCFFGKKLSDVLTSWGFVINPYDQCVANKHINGSTCTVLWHVDDLKISHVDPTVVTSIIAQLSLEFGTAAPLTVHRGKLHEYLGMTLDFSIQKKIKVFMNDYIDKVLLDLPLQLSTICSLSILSIQQPYPSQMLSTSTMLWPNCYSYANVHALTSKLLYQSSAPKCNNLTMMITRNWPASLSIFRVPNTCPLHLKQAMLS